MAEEAARYVAKAAVVKVSVGPADGNTVAVLVRRGYPVPDGVDPAKLEALAARGLIERVPDPEADDEGGPKRPSSRAGVKKWVEYAQALGIDVPEDASLEDVKALVAAHEAAAEAAAASGGADGSGDE